MKTAFRRAGVARAVSPLSGAPLMPGFFSSRGRVGAGDGALWGHSSRGQREKEE